MEIAEENHGLARIGSPIFTNAKDKASNEESVESGDDSNTEGEKSVANDDIREAEEEDSDAVPVVGKPTDAEVSMTGVEKPCNSELDSDEVDRTHKKVMNALKAFVALRESARDISSNVEEISSDHEACF